MQSAVRTSRKAVDAPKYLMSVPPSMSNYPPNQWANITRARRQWEYLRITLDECGAEVDVYEHAEPHKVSASDISNSAVIHSGTAVVPNEATLSGLARKRFVEGWAADKGIKVEHRSKMPTPRNMQIINENLIYGQNTTQEVEEGLMGTERSIPVTMTPISDRLNSLDTVLCPINKTTALYVPDAFDNKSKETLRKLIRLIPVTGEDAHLGACNSIVVGKKVIMQRGCEKTAKLLEELGYETVFVNTTALGAGPKKLALKL